MKTLVHSHAAYSADLATQWVLLENQEIIASGDGERPVADQVVDASGLVLSPAWTDIHCHGGGGKAFEEPESCAEALAVHRATGTGQVVASLVTNPVEDIAVTLGKLARSCEEFSAPTDRTAALVGIHCEGPFLSALHKGAHRQDYLTTPTVDGAKRLFDAAGGYLKQVTIAPELDENLATTKFFVENGVKVAVGHTDADYDTAKAAFDAGASLLTHTFNAMNPLHHRAPGPVAAALDSSHVTLEVICDGVHVYAPMIRLLFEQAAERIALITDAMAATGCADGHYMLGSLDVEVKDSVARLASNGAIAGSTLTLGSAVQNAVAMGISPADALRSATEIPQKALGIEAPAGYILLSKDYSFSQHI